MIFLSNLYTSLQLRGGTREEHLAGNGVGFVGAQKEVTVDTTDYRLRVHDGITIGGHALMKSNDNILATQIVFTDGENLQFKLDNNKLGGTILPPNPTPGIKPNILAIDVVNKLSNGTATINYYITSDSNSILKHEISIDNGKTFTEITPKSNNPFMFVVENLITGQNLCALKITDKNNNLFDVNYFIAEILASNPNTPPSIDSLVVISIEATSFGIEYIVSDQQDDNIVRHEISLDNGYTYTECFPVYEENKYKLNIYGLMPSINYYCRLKVAEKNIESMTYGFNITTKS